MVARIALVDRAALRVAQNLQIEEFLGEGQDGEVWETSDATALKALRREAAYANERDSYLRLKDWGADHRIDGFLVPRLVGHDDELWIVEMEMVQAPPYIIDFAKVRFDWPPEFSDETLRDSEEQGQELFGDNWPKVQSLLATLAADFGIYYQDPKPGNIVFPESP